MEQKYNGWTNYETWNYVLHKDNEQTSQEIMILGAKEYNAIEYADALKEQELDWIATEMDIDGYHKDILENAMCAINWYEVAQYYIEKASEIELA